MKTFTIKGSFSADIRYQGLSLLHEIDIDRLHEVAASLLHRGVVRCWSNVKKGEGVFYLDGKEYFTRDSFMDAASALPVGDHLVMIEVLYQEAVISLDKIDDISIKNLTIMDDKSLRGYIRRLLSLDYSGNIVNDKRFNNWKFHDRAVFNSRGVEPLDPFICIVRDWNLIIHFQLTWNLDDTFSLNVLVEDDPNPQFVKNDSNPQS